MVSESMLRALRSHWLGPYRDLPGCVPVYCNVRRGAHSRWSKHGYQQQL